MDWMTKTPAEIDAVIAKLSAELAAMTPRSPLGWHTTKASDTARELRRQELTVQLAELGQEFASRGGWTRWFRVTNGNGHIHNTTHCQTCYPTTQFAWLVELSGQDARELVKEYGEAVCSVCVPSAPVLAREMGPSLDARQREARRQERAAKRAAAAAKEAARWVYYPDGSRKTLTDVRANIAHEAFEVEADAHEACHGQQRAEAFRLALARNVDALANRLGVPAADLMEKAQKRAAAEYRKAAPIRAQWAEMAKR